MHVLPYSGIGGINNRGLSQAGIVVSQDQKHPWIFFPQPVTQTLEIVHKVPVYELHVPCNSRAHHEAGGWQEVATEKQRCRALVLYYPEQFTVTISASVQVRNKKNLKAKDVS